jgi:hypothetical protein
VFGVEENLEFLERLERERYLVLRSLRVAHAYLNRLEAGQEREREGLGELIDFLRHFAMDHFFAREEALIEEWERRQAIQAHLGQLFLLRQEHDLGRAILQSVAQRALRQQEELVAHQKEALRHQEAIRQKERARRQALRQQEQERLQRERERRQREEASLRGDLGKLITQLSRSLVRGQQAVHTVEVRISRDHGGGVVREIQARFGPDHEVEERYRRLLEELEARNQADISQEEPG